MARAMEKAAVETLEAERVVAVRAMETTEWENKGSRGGGKGL